MKNCGTLRRWIFVVENRGLAAALISLAALSFCGSTTHAQTLLRNGPTVGTDGYLEVGVDEYGSWADGGFGGIGDRYNPLGGNPLGPRTVGFSSGFFLFAGGTQRELLAENKDWQNSTDTNGDAFGDDTTLDRMITSPNVASDTNGDGLDDTVMSSFTVTGGGLDLSFQLTQTVGSGSGAVAFIHQDYTVTNNSASAAEFNMVRAFDGDLLWRPMANIVTNDEVGTTTNGAGLGDLRLHARRHARPSWNGPGRDRRHPE